MTFSVVSMWKREKSHTAFYSTMMLVCHIVYQRIVLVRCLRVAVLGLGVEEEHLSVLHPYHEVDVEQGFLAL